MKRKKNTLGIKNLLGGLAVVTVALAGMFVGRVLQAGPGPEPAVAESQAGLQPELREVTESSLVVDSPFPLVILADATGAPSFTGDLVLGQGAVVLFLDPDCEPCTPAVQRWQAAIDSGEVRDWQVIGIMIRPSAEVAGYAQQQGLTFRVFSDEDDVFRGVHGVEWVPLEVVVGASGFIQSTSHEYTEPVDLAGTLPLLGL